jgi:hypothetical protein
MFNLITCKATKKAVGTNQTAFLRIRTHPPRQAGGVPRRVPQILLQKYNKFQLYQVFCKKCFVIVASKTRNLLNKKHVLWRLDVNFLKQKKS